MGRSVVRVSIEKLLSEADATGFRPDILEKVAHLLNLLKVIRSHPFLKGKLVLKGGTALNLFFFNVPRLSVDIDLNYIGAENRETMLSERPKVEQSMQSVFSREGFVVKRIPTEHAGGKWILGYQSALGQNANLDIDINFMFRIPLWTVNSLDSYMVGSWYAKSIPVINIHELAAGKLAALLSRCQARDIFDSHKILQMKSIDQKRLRTAFVVYGAMNRKDWRNVSINDVRLDINDLERLLIPTLQKSTIHGIKKISEFGHKLVQECQQRLSAILPFTKKEKEFLDLILEKGEICPSLITSDNSIQYLIARHPLIKWKAFNVRQYKNSS